MAISLRLCFYSLSGCRYSTSRIGSEFLMFASSHFVSSLSIISGMLQRQPVKFSPLIIWRCRIGDFLFLNFPIVLGFLSLDGLGFHLYFSILNYFWYISPKLTIGLFIRKVFSSPIIWFSCLKMDVKSSRGGNLLQHYRICFI